MKNYLRPLCAALIAGSLITGCATRPAAPLELNLVALNDFHGNLEASKYARAIGNNKKADALQAGGIDTIGAALQAWRREDADLLFVAAGDLIGASPAMSSMWADEPTITAMSMLGLQASATGNHEFDQGRAELLRQQKGGCDSIRAAKACKFAPDFSGARYTYLAANVIDTATGKPLLPAYRIEQAKGVKVAFIGAVTRDTPSYVLASGIAGLSFVDEADAINASVAKARADGATVFVVLIHEGGHTDEAFNEPDCKNLKGPIVGIVERLDPAIRLIISGHSHTGFLCKVGERTVTQAEMGGHVLSRITLAVDPQSRTLRDLKVSNVLMKPGQYPDDPKMSAYLRSIKQRSDVALARPMAKVAVQTVGRVRDDAGMSPLGELVADAALAATAGQGAQIGLWNTGGLRKDLDVGADLVSTYGQQQAVLPFSNTLVLMDMTGAQLRDLFEQQWVKGQGPGANPHNVLQVSAGLNYQWRKSASYGQHIVPGSFKLNGVPIADAQTYRVVVNNFLAEGGDGFGLFAGIAGKRDTNIRDLDALSDYLAKRADAGKPAGSTTTTGRITRAD